jgi:hypothetical protein
VFVGVEGGNNEVVGAFVFLGCVSGVGGWRARVVTTGRHCCVTISRGAFYGVRGLTLGSYGVGVVRLQVLAGEGGVEVRR